MNYLKINSWRNSWGRNARGSIVTRQSLLRLGLCALLCSFPGVVLAESAQPPILQEGQGGVLNTRGIEASANLPAQQSLGRITGKVVDQTGSIVGGVQIRLAREDQSPSQEVFSDADGQFSFVDVTPGSFQLTITLVVAAQVTQVTVGLTQVERAEVQIKDQEKQRVLGIIPNSATSPMQLLSRRNKSSSLLGSRLSIHSPSSRLALLRELRRQGMSSADTGKARKVTQNAMAHPMATLL
jgi:hypothetical protein